MARRAQARCAQHCRQDARLAAYRCALYRRRFRDRRCRRAGAHRAGCAHHLPARTQVPGLTGQGALMILLRSLITLVLLAAFITLWVWAWRGERREEFAAAARLPLDDGERDA